MKKMPLKRPLRRSLRDVSPQFCFVSRAKFAECIWRLNMQMAEEEMKLECNTLDLTGNPLWLLPSTQEEASREHPHRPSVPLLWRF